jgi:hypothetical protein
LVCEKILFKKLKLMLFGFNEMLKLMDESGLLFCMDPVKAREEERERGREREGEGERGREVRGEMKPLYRKLLNSFHFLLLHVFPYLFTDGFKRAFAESFFSFSRLCFCNNNELKLAYLNG